MFFEKIVMKLSVLSGEGLCWSIVLLIARKRPVVFQFLHSTADFCLTCSGFFWVAVPESNFEGLLLEQYFSFRDLVIKT